MKDLKKIAPRNLFILFLISFCILLSNENIEGQTLKYGDTYHIKNAFAAGSYLETCGYGTCTDGTKYTVTTHTQPNRANENTGKWTIESPTGKSSGTEVMIGDIVYLKNGYAAGSYLETCGYGTCTDGTKYNVTTHAQPNRDRGTTAKWQIISTTGAANGTKVSLADRVYLKNAFAEGSYLETCGYSECTDGSKYNVSTHTQANRDNYGSGTWSFQTLEPPKFQYKVEDSEAGSNFTQNDNPHAWIYTASKNWMGYLPDYIQLKDISIPGTHDSGARYGGLAAECQSWTVTEQLQAGIRYLDIRCRPTGDAFAIHHGAFFQKQMFGDIMNEVTSFLQNNPTEVVTLRLKMEADNNKKNQEDFQKIWNSYANRYQDYLYKGTDPDLTLGEARGKIYVMCDAECSGYGKHYSEKNSEIQDFYKVYWLAHKQTKGDNWATLPSKKEKIKKYIDKAAGSSTWVLNHLSGAVGMTPPDVARSTNAETYKYLEGRGKSKLGIIIMDFPGEKLIYRIIKSNFDFSSYCNCPPKTFRVSSHHSWAEFRLPQGTGNQTINIKGGAYNKYKFPKCNRVRWSDLEFVCNPSSCNWEKVKGDWDADANCHGSKGNSPYVFVGNK